MVVNMPGRTIRFMQRVRSLDAVTIPVLMMRLVVSGVVALYFVLELVLGMSLEVINDIITYLFFD